MKRRKPHDPAKAARAAIERAEQEAIVQHAVRQGAEVKSDRAGRATSIYRSNVFTRLLEANSITADQHNAAMVLVGLWATWKGLEGRSGASEYVDGGMGCAELVTDRMLRAGTEVQEALSQVGPMDRALLQAFMVATVEEDRPMAWRGIVERVSGISVRDRQSTVVVMALENLRQVFSAPRRNAA